MNPKDEPTKFMCWNCGYKTGDRKVTEKKCPDCRRFEWEEEDP